jgi:glycerophosphoryl diester phosphodiesterase
MLVFAAAWSAGTAAAHAATPQIHAHRGGSVVNGVPTYPENTMPAFVNAAAAGYVVELDAVLTRDGRGVVIHDSTLDRTTVCSGRVDAWYLADLLASCPSDVLGSPGSQAGGFVVPDLRVRLSSLREVLDWAKTSPDHPILNLEIKNIPTEAGFDPTLNFATKIVKEVKASGLPAGQIIIQSFWPLNLDVSELLMPKVATSLLTLNALNAGGPAYALARGYEWVSPQWPVDALVVDLAHAVGRKAVPWTLDTPADVRAAAATGAEALITNDPAMAQAALGG